MRAKLKQLNGGSVSGHLVTNASGLVTSLKNNLSASVDPTNTNDGSIGQGYSEGSMWINTTAKRTFTCADATTNAAVWKQAGGFGYSGYKQTFTTTSQTYYSSGLTSPSVQCYFEFPGTAVAGTPSKFRVLTSRNGATGTAYVRLYDLTNSLEIALVSYTSATMQFNEDTSLTNLPTGAAIFEVDLYVSSGSANASRLHYFSLE